jgi:hypothetical protein
MRSCAPSPPQTAVELNLVLNLKRALDVALIRASDLVRILDFGLDHAEDPVGNLDLHLGLERACDRALDLARAIDLAHEALKCGVEGTCSLDPSFARALLQNCDFKLDAASDRAGELARAIDVERASCVEAARNAAHDFVTEVELARRRVSTFADWLSFSMAHSDEQPDGGANVRVSPLAGRLTGAAASLLPRADRSRYAEEYQAELYELAQFSRQAQWAYAVRLLACALPLRRELRRDAHEVVPGR